MSLLTTTRYWHYDAVENNFSSMWRMIAAGHYRMMANAGREHCSLREISSYRAVIHSISRRNMIMAHRIRYFMVSAKCS